MRVAVLTNEYPPQVYGGAGVHVDFLVRELRRLVEVEVHCFGQPRQDARAYLPPSELADANGALRALSIDLEMADGVGDVGVIHSHTWYANLGGHLAKLLHDKPHVVTAHSLEPLRPWKAEQLGGGYRISSWAEKTAYEAADAVIAVSNGMRADVLAAYPTLDPERIHVVHNGVDTELYAPTGDDAALRKVGIDQDRPYILYVGRITRQKGITHLLAAAERLDRDVQIVLCASAPDTPELAAEVTERIEHLRAGGHTVLHQTEMLPREDVISLLSHAATFVCPSVYEPLGIVNLEAMACRAPVVASAVGGIPEVVQDGVTGLLVPYTPDDLPAFEAGLAEALATVVGDPIRGSEFGRAGRKRAVDLFSWEAIAEQTITVYMSLG
ncbi:glycogen synthase [Cryptosporangium aurantiacum]|uniref:Glycogen synthase (ADP-glucose) n=1 Tax=Cryptosporangium aurantiacum TaxID=134849 RepID=A0A1M7QQ58_9ACTN|nr:glycogen synthase [Cryptosporangium aurantiacum]SHN33586.1 glycogen synthase (ADP-glucose) [Cryptosporangium aurantiacum]